MRVSVNWLKKYVNLQGVSIEELTRRIGARLVEIEGVIDETHKYDKIYVVEVKEAEKIPDTHLTLCKIDNGGEELIQVVCGAPNVRKGMLAVWLAPGAVVPASAKEDAPFIIGKRKMLNRYESNGMLAGADELDFGDDHSGIVEIDPEMGRPGMELKDLFELEDYILDIENKSLTHRPDCFGIIGFAREVAGIFGQKFVEPEMSGKKKLPSGVEVEIMDEEICARYSAVTLEKHGELKKKYLSYIDTLLAKSGMRPVSTIVDTTNYLMLLTGQPLHAFDYDKFIKVGGGETAKIVVRLAREGEKLVLLDEKEITLNRNDIVICSGEVPVALAGAMGGASTAVDEQTKRIIIESATFSLYNLRKTQMEHGIFSEAITRFTKGQPAYQTVAVAEECAKMLEGGFKVATLTDKYVKEEKIRPVEIEAEEINALLGTEYDTKLIIKTLENVGFGVKKHNKGLSILAPEWRTDIHIKEDIIEEVGRLLGYEQIMPTLPRHLTADKNKLFELENKVRDLMCEFGANEVLTYSFVSERLLSRAGVDYNNSYKIINSISPDLQYIRQSIVPSLLDKAYMNQKMPIEKFALFEINKVYQKNLGMNEEEVPVEKINLGFVVAERKNKETAYYKAKLYIEKLLEKLNIAKPRFLPLNPEGSYALCSDDSEKNCAPGSAGSVVSAGLAEGKTGVDGDRVKDLLSRAEARPFEEKRAAAMFVGETYIGVVGEFKNSVKRNFKLEEYVAGFEIDFLKLLDLAKPTKEIRDFTLKNSQDITIATDKTYAETLAELRLKYPEAEISPVSIYQPTGANKKITFHISQ
ncbi:MAG: phenylalanine--tRNA ligase subunit beta [Candidatus Saccharibacteria bacterium]|nr:phenylalanine--tRNA ligase subunit beta [Candidatus Saccharibacteria bacterium]